MRASRMRRNSNNKEIESQFECFRTLEKSLADN